MDMTHSLQPSEIILRLKTWRIWLPQLLTGLYLAITFVIFGLIPFWAVDWKEKPFLGAVFDTHLVLSNVNSTEKPSLWPLRSQGTGLGFKIAFIDKKPVANANELAIALSEYKIGDAVAVTVKPPNQQMQTYQVELIRFPNQDWINFFILPYLIGFAYLASGLWIFVIHRHQAGGRAFTILAASVAIAVAGLFDFYTTHAITYLWVFALAFTGSGLFNLVLLFPQEDPSTSRQPFLRHGTYLAAMLVAAYALYPLISPDNSSSFSQALRLVFAFCGLEYLFSMGWWIFYRMRVVSSIVREQLRYLLYAALISFCPLGIWFVLSSIRPDFIAFSPFILLPLVVFPAAAGFVIQRYRLAHTDYIFSRAIVYGLLVILISSGYALLVSGLGVFMVGTAFPGMPIVNGVIFIILALLIHPLRVRLKAAVDGVFFRSKQAYQERLQSFSSELTRAVELKEIFRIIRGNIQQTILPEGLHIFIYDPLSQQFTAVPDETGHPTSDLRYSCNQALPRWFSDQHTPFLLNDLSQLPTSLKPELVRLRLLRAVLFIPLPGRQRLAGWLALGARSSGEPYTSRELAFLDALSDQAALAIERAQVVVKIENQAREMNVLARISQGINITLALDDILEMVFTQITLVIAADDFHILLVDKDSDTLVESFCVENNERLNQFENLPVRNQTTLEQEVLRQQKSFVTDDFNRERQRRGFVGERFDLFAWACIPLNSGAQVIGLLVLGKRDALVTYSSEQIALLQAIADQVAGAIVKGRLLQETEQRAKQMSILNRVTRQLTSLEMEPLLQIILQSATDILDCEAGTLLLLDQQSDELVFRVTVGPPATSNLIGRRLPAGAGLAGKAILSRQAEIVNNVKNAPEWINQTDQQTGFITKAIMVIPLLVKDKVFGVIQVINKRDGSLFSSEDLSLLSAFAAQAAVAIENARLYTMTEQALSARVEELSVMQRIDRELNAGLDTGHIASIALGWAMKQSGASAGLVALIRNGHLQVIASHGYGEELAGFQDNLIPQAYFSLEDVIQEGVPRWETFEEGLKKGLLSNSCSQVIVPIRRENSTIGVIWLESKLGELFSDELLNFLLRLSDHSSIAISNAQLYSAVQAANIAKSEFVSFVSHELKNPMTSIKGYTELLAVGAVGPVNEAQANFLATIRSNVERMATLVSDLTDLSRIEAGRLRLDFQALFLKEIVDEVARTFHRQMVEKNQELVLQLPDNLPQVWADRTRLFQIVTNLVSNANKYSPAGSHITLGAEACENHWDSSGAPRVVHIWVQDEGVGITEEDQVKIFQKYFRSDDPKVREVTGTGLGLNITRSLIEFQGGRIWFESEYRRGTKFHFTIPVTG